MNNYSLNIFEIAPKFDLRHREPSASFFLHELINFPYYVSKNKFFDTGLILCALNYQLASCVAEDLRLEIPEQVHLEKNNIMPSFEDKPSETYAFQLLFKKSSISKTSFFPATKNFVSRLPEPFITEVLNFAPPIVVRSSTKTTEHKIVSNFGTALLAILKRRNQKIKTRVIKSPSDLGRSLEDVFPKYLRILDPIFNERKQAIASSVSDIKVAQALTGLKQSWVYELLGGKDA